MCDNYDTEQLGECASCCGMFALEDLDRDDLCEECAGSDTYEDQLKIVCAICAGIFNSGYLDHNCICDECNKRLDKEENK